MLHFWREQPGAATQRPKRKTFIVAACAVADGANKLPKQRAKACGPRSFDLTDFVSRSFYNQLLKVESKLSHPKSRLKIIKWNVFGVSSGVV